MSTALFLDDIVGVLLPLVAALGLSLLATPLVIRLARWRDWLAYPKADRWHESPTALMGGIAIYAAVSITVGALYLIASVELPILIWAGSTILFIAGFIDDRREINPVAKLLVQFAAATMIVWAGYQFAPDWPIWLSIPLSFLWIIGVTNAVNLLDNMDGLSAGITAITSVILAAFGLLTGSPEAAVYALIVAGAAGGFLWYNFNPARIFMGDCGSLFLGYTVAALALAIQSSAPSTGVFAVILVPAAVMAVPIFDTSLVTVMRVLSGRPVSQGGRDHSSHRLVFLGFSERSAVLSLYAVSLAFGTLALMLYFAEVKLLYAVGIYMAVGLAVLGRFLGYTNVYEETGNAWKEHILPAQEADSVLLRGMLRHKRKMAGIVVDFLLITASWMIAFHLRFEDGIPANQLVVLEDCFPLIILPKLVLFYAAGLYGRIWRRAGASEMIRVVGATFAGSVVAYALVVFAAPLNVSEAVFVIDWMLSLLAVAGVRFATRVLRQVLAERRSDGRRVMLYGAGRGGTLSLREIRQNESLHFEPVGFIDDDREKHGHVIHGLRVLGSFEDLDELCDEYDVEEILITTSRLSAVRLVQCVEFCEERGISCREFDITFADTQLFKAGDGASVEVA